MQRLIYPSKVMNITQNYNGSTSHYAESHGKPFDYPIDEACADGGRDYFYAPCDLIIKRIYGVGSKGTNTIWLQSVSKVKLANSKESYVTIMVIHPEDDDLKKLKIGQKFKQFEKIFREGKDGHATGNHFHIVVSDCEFSKLLNKGWVENNKGQWVMTPNAIKPEEAFFIDKKFTKIKNAGGLKFKEISVAPTPAPAPTKKQKLYLPASAKRWRVYKLNVVPRVGNECGYLYPAKFGGLEYDILRWTKYKDVCVIKTRDFGEVQIYVAKSTGAIIK